MVNVEIGLDNVPHVHESILILNACKCCNYGGIAVSPFPKVRHQPTAQAFRRLHLQDQWPIFARDGGL